MDNCRHRILLSVVPNWLLGLIAEWREKTSYNILPYQNPLRHRFYYPGKDWHEIARIKAGSDCPMFDAVIGPCGHRNCRSCGPKL